MSSSCSYQTENIKTENIESESQNDKSLYKSNNNIKKTENAIKGKILIICRSKSKKQTIDYQAMKIKYLEKSIKQLEDHVSNELDETIKGTYQMESVFIYKNNFKFVYKIYR